MEGCAFQEAKCTPFYVSVAAHTYPCYNVTWKGIKKHIKTPKGRTGNRETRAEWAKKAIKKDGDREEITQ